jgi:DNA repair ATPase RecN
MNYYKIASVHTEDIKNHSDVQITFSDESTALVGPNGSGKSTTIKAIYSALSGKTGRIFVKEGEEKGHVSLTLQNGLPEEELTIDVELSTLDPKNFKMNFFQGGQKMPASKFKSLISNDLNILTLNPAKFISGNSAADISPADIKKMVDAFLDLVGFDQQLLESKDKQISLLEQDQKLAKKVVADLEIRRDALAQQVGKFEAEQVAQQYNLTYADGILGLVSVDSLQGQISGINESLILINNQKNNINNLNFEYKNSKNKISEIKITEEISVKNKEGKELISLYSDKIDNVLSENVSKLTGLDSQIAKLESERSDLSLKIGSLGEVNRQIGLHNQVKEMNQEIAKLTNDWLVKKEDWTLARQEKADFLASYDFGIEGLGILVDVEGSTTTGGIVDLKWKGRALSECSDGERMLIASILVMRKPSSVKTLMVENASLMDDEAIDSLIATANERGYSVILEMVRRGEDHIDMVIEFADGKIKKMGKEK